MDRQTFRIAMEHFVKSNVYGKSYRTAKERGTVDKLIIGMSLKFTKRYAPKKTWNISRDEVRQTFAELTELFAGNQNLGVYLDNLYYVDFRDQGGVDFLLYASASDEAAYIALKLPEQITGNRFGYLTEAPKRVIDVLDTTNTYIVLEDGERAVLDLMLHHAIYNGNERFILN